MFEEGSKKAGILELARYSLKNLNYFKALKARERARKPIFLANMEIGKLDINDPIYPMRIEEYNQAVIEYYTGKFLATEASRTGNKTLWKKAFNGFSNGTKIGKELLQALRTDSKKQLMIKKSGITRKGTEIKFSNDVPLVPEITPVVVLEGSNYEMGYQYARQLIQIYGKWILERKTGKIFTEKQREHMNCWMKEHDKHTPWLSEFIDGWVQGANESGTPISREDIIYLWVGAKVPANDFLSQDGLPEVPPIACSGMAAWGSATSDGKLVTGSTGDHDLSYQMIIVAYPDDGNAFIYSAFGATGDIAGGGDTWFFGHPAMNSKGVAYVHHGGGPKFLEPKKYWGYGIRRAASVMHIMRYADSAKQALDMEMSMPIGDIGYGDQATVGGFYADDIYGYVIEGRKEPVAIRETGLLGETDFLYANNSTCHPNAIESEWMSSIKDQWRWDPQGGWRPKTDVGMVKSIGLFLQWASGRLSTSDMMIRGMMMGYTNSYYRNLYIYKHLDAAKGRITPEYMKAMYRNGGKLPEGPWDKIVDNYKKTGNWGKISIGHASNALTAIMKPSEGLFSLCTGPAKRGLTPLMPGAIIPIYNATNAFYELKLEETPKQMRSHTCEVAYDFITDAELELENVELNENTKKMLEGYLQEARDELSQGDKHSECSSIFSIAAAVRCYTRAQVRARQVINSINPPPADPADLLARALF